MSTRFRAKKFQRFALYFGAGLLALLVLIRVIAPPIIHKRLNDYLAEFSPLYSIHIGDLDLAIWRMAYGLEDIELKERKTGQVFLFVQDVDVSLSWRELIRGRVLTDIDVTGARFDVDRGIVLLAKGNPETSKKDAKDAQEALFPVSVERVRVTSSEALFRPPGTKSDTKAWRLSEIESVVSNLTPKTENEKTLFTASGTLLGSSKVKVAGEARLKKEPIEWSVDTQMNGFDLREANPILMEIAPLSFVKGQLDVYSEVRSKAGTMLGYVRPVAKNVDVMGDRRDFKEGPRQFLIELVAQFAQFVLKDNDTSTVATQIDFGTAGGELKVNTAKAIQMAIQHGFGENVEPKIDNRLELPNKNKEK